MKNEPRATRRGGFIMEVKQMYYYLYEVSADGGKTFTEQWMTQEEAADRRNAGYIVLRKGYHDGLPRFVPRLN